MLVIHDLHGNSHQRHSFIGPLACKQFPHDDAKQVNVSTLGPFAQCIEYLGSRPQNQNVVVIEYCIVVAAAAIV